jgi:hypothetical protein
VHVTGIDYRVVRCSSAWKNATQYSSVSPVSSFTLHFHVQTINREILLVIFTELVDPVGLVNALFDNL